MRSKTMPPTWMIAKYPMTITANAQYGSGFSAEVPVWAVVGVLMTGPYYCGRSFVDHLDKRLRRCCSGDL